jgi:hypothetical protein
MVNYAQGWKNLHAAVHTLAGASDQKQRLENAIISDMSRINPDYDLPPEIRHDFAVFMGQMRSQRTRDSEGAVWELIKRMDGLQRQQAITRIIDFYDAVSRTVGHDDCSGDDSTQLRIAGMQQDFDG